MVRGYLWSTREIGQLAVLWRPDGDVVLMACNLNMDELHSADVHDPNVGRLKRSGGKSTDGVPCRLCADQQTGQNHQADHNAEEYDQPDDERRVITLTWH